ncbi:MAG: DNA-3-methyladenine glycosylase I [Gammaproteobacteria bacterium]|nr:DNA-3-methyladenine glycosylase I [Gammaproteobacteria bacterium]
MDSFDSIFQQAAQRKGGSAELEGMLPAASGAEALRAMTDDRYLAEMTRCVFRSGFVWKIIENKWPGFEAAFHGFDVATCAMLSDEELERLTENEAIVRNAKKIRSVPGNAAFILDVRETHGSFGSYLADWPVAEIVALWDDMKKRGNRLGGQTGRFFLRFVGKDTPMFSTDVVKALIAQGVVDKEPTSKKALQQAQNAFNVWREESGRDLCQISRVLALSLD